MRTVVPTGSAPVVHGTSAWQWLTGFLIVVMTWFGTSDMAAAAGDPSYPIKTIKLVLPYPAAGGADSLARPLASQLSRRLGQSVVIDNKGGAGGNIAME